MCNNYEQHVSYAAYCDALQAEALEVMHIEPPLLNGVEIDRILTEELTPVWQGAKPVREALTAASAKVKPLLNAPE